MKRFKNFLNNVDKSFKVGDGGYSSRKLIAFQLMISVAFFDIIFVYLLWRQDSWSKQIFIELIIIHLVAAAFFLGYIFIEQIIKLVLAVRNGIKPEEKKEDEK